MTERRIKAVATVSAVDVGAATRKGWDGKGSEADLLATLDAVAKQRSAEAAGAAPVYVNYVPEDWRHDGTPRSAGSSRLLSDAARPASRLDQPDADDQHQHPRHRSTASKGRRHFSPSRS